MTTINFASSLTAVLAAEGGFTDNRRDPGGRTNHGVTQREYDDWRERHGLPHRDVLLITPQEISAIYHEDYWQPAHCDALPAGVDYCVFDFAVNSGPHQAIVCLQRAAGVDDDGRVGPATLAAIKAADPRRLVHLLCAERLSFMQRHCDWADFGNGWSRRVASVEVTARGMA